MQFCSTFYVFEFSTVGTFVAVTASSSHCQGDES